jgi:hypothetical protein
MAVPFASAVFRGLEKARRILPRLGKFRELFSGAWNTASVLGPYSTQRRKVQAQGAKPLRLPLCLGVFDFQSMKSVRIRG